MPRGFLAHRSKQELRFTAHLRQLLFGHVDDTSLEEAVQQGERAHNADCGLHLDATRLYVEWDGERCHATQERIEADVRKTRLLLSDESAVVVRLRSKCPPIPQLDLDKRVFVVLTKSNPVEALGDMARQGVASLLPEPYAARMQSAAGFYAGARTWRVAEQALQDLLRRKQVEFGQRVRELADVTGGGVAGKLSRFYEALVSGALLAGAHRLAAAPYRISGSDLVKFMCGGVAAALSPERREGFFECLDCLAAAPYHISGGRLVSFMRNSVAAALSPERRDGFFAELSVLMGASATRLPTQKEVLALCRRVMLQHPAIIVKLVKRDGEWRVLA